MDGHDGHPANAARWPGREVGALARVAGAMLLALLLAGCTSVGPAAPDPGGSGASIITSPTQKSRPPGNPLGLARPGRRGLQVGTFREAMALPASELDVGRAALLLAREDRPDLDLARYLTQLDVLAADLRDLLTRSPGVSRRDLLAAYLYGPGGFTADPDDPHGHDVQNLHLDRVLERRRGYCVSLSLLGLAVAERLDLPLRGVRVPSHYYLELDGQGIETTDGGRLQNRADYARRHPLARLSQAYLHPVAPRSIFAEVLSNRGALALRRGDLARARESLELALQVDPTLPTVWHNQAVARRAEGDLAGAQADLDQALQLDPGGVASYHERAEVLLLMGRNQAAASALQQAIRLAALSDDERLQQESRRRLRRLLGATSGPGQEGK